MKIVIHIVTGPVGLYIQASSRLAREGKLRFGCRMQGLKFEFVSNWIYRSGHLCGGFPPEEEMVGMNYLVLSTILGVYYHIVPLDYTGSSQALLVGLSEKNWYIQSNSL